MKRLELEALKADLAAVRGLLERRDANSDPVGWMQFSQRRDELEKKLSEVETTSARQSSVALYFGGRPVSGSSGISARFGSSAIEMFQDLVSTRLASSNGILSEAGPIPHRERSALLITEIARGSFGFVLEAADEIGSDTTDAFSLEKTLDDVCALIQSAADTDEQKFSEAYADQNSRVVNHMTRFLRLLDESGATLRIVDDHRDFSFQRRDIELARARIDTLEVNVQTFEVEGRIYVLPSSRRFDLFSSGQMQPFSGVIAPALFERLSSDEKDGLDQVIGTLRKFVIELRSVHSKRSSPRVTYTLKDLRPL